MKKFITLLLALGLGISVMAPVTSEARDHRRYSRQAVYSHSCGYCGGPMYRQQIVVGYSRYGHPMYSWRPVSHIHRSGYGRGHHRGHDHHRHHRDYRGSVSSSGFYFGFGR